MSRLEIDGDAERLQAIFVLQQAISAKQPDLAGARRQRDCANSAVGNARQQLEETDRAIADVGTEVHSLAGGVYLNGETSLDRGKLSLGNDVVRFRGWHGEIAFPLASISQVDLGQSFLPPRAGIPLLERVWPGKPRAAGALLLTLGDPRQGIRERAVVADLQDASKWRDDIADRQGRLPQVARRRSRLTALRERTLGEWGVASQNRSIAQGHLDTLQGRMAALVSKRDVLRAQQRQIDELRQQALRARQARRRR